MNLETLVSPLRTAALLRRPHGRRPETATPAPAPARARSPAIDAARPHRTRYDVLMDDLIDDDSAWDDLGDEEGSTDAALSRLATAARCVGASAPEDFADTWSPR